MRVRLLSGHAAGICAEVPQTEGEVLIATGFAAAALDAVVGPLPEQPAAAVAEPPSPAPPVPGDPAPVDAGGSADTDRS
jgi:hypothetical protein